MSNDPEDVAPVPLPQQKVSGIYVVALMEAADLISYALGARSASAVGTGPHAKNGRSSSRLWSLTWGAPGVDALRASVAAYLGGPPHQWQGLGFVLPPFCRGMYIPHLHPQDSGDFAARYLEHTPRRMGVA